MKHPDDPDTPLLTLDEFVERLPISGAAFREATLKRLEKDPNFPVLQDEISWYRELLAYQIVTEIEEALGNDRDSNDEG